MDCAGASANIDAGIEAVLFVEGVILGFDLIGGAAPRPQPAKDFAGERRLAATSRADFLSCVAAGLFKPRLSLNQRPFDRFLFLFVQFQFMPTFAFRLGARSALAQFPHSDPR